MHRAPIELALPPSAKAIVRQGDAVVEEGAVCHANAAALRGLELGNPGG
jgi:hypothetical protein